jgi:hypothetical protein
LCDICHVWATSGLFLQQIELFATAKKLSLSVTTAVFFSKTGSKRRKLRAMLAPEAVIRFASQGGEQKDE